METADSSVGSASRTIVVTGAGGFVGSRLARCLIEDPAFAADRLVLCDLALPTEDWRAGVRCVLGDISDPDTLRDVLRDGADIVFHLAGVLGGAAEANPRLARRINIDATLSLIEALTDLPNRPRLVYASSIAVFGRADHVVVDDATPPDPTMLYGAQKRMIEIALEQASARGWIEGLALRLPGIVARPASSQGLKTAFLSDLFHDWAAGRDLVLPVSPDGSTWLLSVTACAQALIHAASVPAASMGPRRAMTLPALNVRFADLMAALRAARPDSRSAVTYDPISEIEATFGRKPPLTTELADRLGFRHDGDVHGLVRSALETLGR